MSIKIITDKNTVQSVMYDEATKIAFGPVFGADEHPQDFLEWFAFQAYEESNVQMLFPGTLSRFVDKWRTEVKENEVEAAGERAMNEPEAWEGGFASNH